MVPRSTLLQLFPDNVEARNLYRSLCETCGDETYHATLQELQQDNKESVLADQVLPLLAKLKGAGLIQFSNGYEHITRFSVKTERIERIERPVMMYHISIAHFSHEEKAS